jgi:hypothetical protein
VRRAELFATTERAVLTAPGGVGQKASRRGQPRAKVARIGALTCGFFVPARRKNLVIATCDDAVRIEPGRREPQRRVQNDAEKSQTKSQRSPTLSDAQRLAEHNPAGR